MRSSQKLTQDVGGMHGCLPACRASSRVPLMPFGLQHRRMALPLWSFEGCTVTRHTSLGGTAVPVLIRAGSAAPESVTPLDAPSAVKLKAVRAFCEKARQRHRSGGGKSEGPLACMRRH